MFTYADCEQTADLAYAQPGTPAQGRTVSAGLAVFTGTENREWTYMALTRAADGNYAYVMTASPACAHCGEAIGQLEPGQWSADGTPAGTRCEAAPGRQHSRTLPPGSRPAARDAAGPELARHERIQQERSGGLAVGEASVAGAPGPGRLGVLSDVLEREGAEPSALEVQRRNLANADHLGKLHAIWEGETKDAIRARYEQSLREQLPAQYQNTPLSGAATWLWRSLRSADAAGLDANEVLSQAISAKPLTGARDLVAVIDSRVREETARLVPQPAGPWSARVPEIDDPARREYVTALAKTMDERTERLGEFTAEARQRGRCARLGPVPDEPLERLEWERRAAPIAAYRELFGFGDPAEPIGPEPSGDTPERRAAWHAAFARARAR